MPFCQMCGAPVEGKFCGKCGAPAAGGAAGGPVHSADSDAAIPENLACALCYLLGAITGLLFLVLEPYSRNKNVRFHAFQSIFYMAAYFVINFAVGLLVPLGLVWGVSFFLPMAGFILWVYLMVRAYQNHRVVLPVIGPMAEKQV